MATIRYDKGSDIPTNASAGGTITAIRKLLLGDRVSLGFFFDTYFCLLASILMYSFGFVGNWASKWGSLPLVFTLQKLHQRTLQHKIPQESSSTTSKTTKNTIMSQHQTSGNIDSFNIKDSYNKVWNNCTIADEDSEILTWLSPLEPQTRHRDIRTRRIDNVGGWLLETEEYRNWFRGISDGGPNGSALFCYGGPGVGKTYIR